ncbi:hypothetical protein ANAPC5_00123 [Anaplasma phagocytophilum]|nr:hypothetical protein ANAPC5_00123 [Anaplasma phagocytophilum]
MLRTFSSVDSCITLFVAISFQTAIRTSKTIPTTAIHPVTGCIMNIATRYTKAHGISKSENIPTPVIKPLTVPRSLITSPLVEDPFIDVKLMARTIRSGVVSLSIQSATFAIVRERQTSNNAEHASAEIVTILSIASVDALPLESTRSKTWDVYNGRNSARILIAELNQKTNQNTLLHFSNV